MATRSVLEITRDMKESIGKLIDANKRIEEVKRDLILATVEILNLKKELERVSIDECREKIKM